ncbi:DUF1330 domain-containing protein [Ilumatobacter sp.]|uniref:DUF1330 domain-containing protein n=1 Tax=Ilumatobacter sp. TaxID=1967498 RepID=UPI003B52774A
MTAYLVANYDVVDLDAYRSYQQQASPLMAGGAKILVLDDRSEAKEGEPGAQTVVIEYPTREAAEAAYGSEEYQSVVGIRHGATANGRAVIVDGFEMPSS